MTFLPANIRIECVVGESIFEVAQRAGVAIETACVGKATCGLCRVKILEGESCLTPLGPSDRKHLGNVYFLTKVRLSCQARLCREGEVTVEIPARAQ